MITHGCLQGWCGDNPISKLPPVPTASPSDSLSSSNGRERRHTDESEVSAWFQVVHWAVWGVACFGRSAELTEVWSKCPKLSDLPEQAAGTRTVKNGSRAF